MNAPLEAPKRRRGKNAGNKGQGSNWISKKRRLQIYARDEHRCIWCLRSILDPGYWRRSTIDHVVPRAIGGTNHSHNLVTACMSCNLDRADTSLYAYAHAKFSEPLVVILRVLAALDRPLPGAP